MKYYIDLSNLLTVDFVTGIQRVAREIMVRLAGNPQHEFVLLTYSGRIGGFLRIDNAQFLAYFRGETDDKSGIVTMERVELTDMTAGAVFFDIDSVWNSCLKRSWLYPELKRQGLRIVTQLYDLIPITHPQFCHENTTANFILYTGAIVKYTDLVITNSGATVRALDALCDQLSMPHKNCVVVPLSSDFAKKAAKPSDDETLSEVTKIAAAGRYILMLGTVEPRKNHALVLDALESGLVGEDMSVVIAGRIGWNVEALEKRIRSHKLLGKQLYFVERPSDAAVDYLYHHAFAVAFPTFNEGFGLPIIEAFLRGAPVLASDIEVLHEVAGEFADYFDPHDKDDFLRCLKTLMNDEAAYQSRRDRLKGYKPYPWDACAAAMLQALESLQGEVQCVPETVRLRQMVCLTARNDDILATLPFIEAFMPFIEELVLCTPDANVDELKANYHGRLHLQFLTDSQILDGRKLPEDHGTRNFFLRALALKNPVIDDVFIMTDDDYRPLREIQQTDFIRDGKYLAYYSYDLQQWHGSYGALTSFDRQQMRTCEFLLENGYPTRMYASHQMQVIDKRIYNEMTTRYAEVIDKGLCEWATYFNYAMVQYPGMFESVPYVSMGWPGAITDWDLYVQPKDFLFENHYSVLYEEGQVFAGLREDFHEKTREENQIKVMRFAAQLQRQMESRRMYDAYCASYRQLYREEPAFMLVAAPERGLRVVVPAFLTVCAGGFLRLPFAVDKRIFADAPGEVLVSYWFSDARGEPLTFVTRLVIVPDALTLTLPVHIPNDPQRCIFHIRVLQENPDAAADGAVWTSVI